MDALTIIRAIAESLQQPIKRGMGKHGISLSFNDDEISDAEVASLTKSLITFFEMINESYRFAERLSQGILETDASRDNILAMPLKALQANLRHLTWQASQVAAGDFSQKVHFLGEFSEAFNYMIGSLRDKAVLEQRFQIITDLLGEGIFLVDSDGMLIFMNPEAERLLGYGFEYLTTRPVYEIIHIQQPDGTYLQPRQSSLAVAIREGKEYRNDDDAFTCKSGQILPVSIVSRPVISGGINTGSVIAFNDITERKKYIESLELINQLLEQQAMTDPLTGIYNRLKITKALETEIDRAQRYNSHLSVILLDVDKFKSINDTYGHLEGDAVLKKIADLLTDNIRTTDILGRWGGEEFILLTPGLDLERAAQFAEKLRIAVERHAFPIQRSITSSFGVTVFNTGDTEFTLTNRADQALYTAKQNGRNRVEVCRL